jgi:ribosomal protein S27AE
MEAKLREPKFETECPPVCPKPDCGGTVFLPHEDGWQCFNCMKIIYKAQSQEGLAPVIRYAHYQKN